MELHVGSFLLGCGRPHPLIGGSDKILNRLDVFSLHNLFRCRIERRDRGFPVNSSITCSVVLFPEKS
jgi:hypothetical protein